MALRQRGLDVHVISLHGTSLDYGATQMHRLPSAAPLGYLRPGPLRRLLSRIKPDILHAHYATGYGHLAARSGFHPRALSVWGSDVLLFPGKSPLHRAFLRRNLRAMDLILSTSKVMERAVLELVPGQSVALTPFGVDTEQFAPADAPRPRSLRVGTVKGLAPVYGIDTLIRALALAVEEADQPMTLEIYGDGPSKAELHTLVRDLGLGDRVRFHGRIAHASVPQALADLDIFAALSRSESFGVSALEASACGLPVLVSDAPGLREVTEDGTTGLVVPRDDPEAAAAALRRLAQDAGLRQRMGQAGRQRVLDLYDWPDCVDRMIAQYRRLVPGGAEAHLSGTAGDV